MKKLFAVLMALVLALSLGCTALAEEPATPADEITALNWLLETLTKYDWIEKDGRTTIEIYPSLDDTSDDTLMVVIYGPNSASDGVEWRIWGKYDADKGIFSASTVARYDVQYDDAGELELSTNVYTRDELATLEMDENGALVLTYAADEDINKKVFEPVPAAAAKTTEITEEQKAIIEKALQNLMGVDYTPIAIVDEVDYMLCVLCEASVVYPGAEPYPVLMVINTNADEPNNVYFIDLVPNDSQG